MARPSLTTLLVAELRKDDDAIDQWQIGMKIRHLPEETAEK
jgi:hypothetical protein